MIYCDEKEDSGPNKKWG